LTVVAGLPGSGSGAYLRGLAEEASAQGREVLFVVPRDADAVRARADMAAVASIGARVATLDGIIESEWALRGDGRRLIQGSTRAVLLSRALISTGMAERPGRGLIALLGTLAERARESVANGIEASDLPGRLVRSIAAYRALVSDYDMVERSEMCRILGSCPPPAALVVADGFIDLHADYEGLLSSWASGRADVAISIAWMEGVAGTESATALVGRLQGAGGNVHIMPAREGSRPDELERARRELFAGPAPLSGSGAVELAVAESQEAEAHFIALAAASRIAAGSPPDGIVIAFADPRRHEPWLRRALEDAGVPATFSISTPVGETPMGSALLGLRSCVQKGLTRQDLSVLMRSPFSGVHPERADAADWAWRAAGRSQGRSLLRRADALGALLEETASLTGRPIDSQSSRIWKSLADRLLANAYPGVAPTPGADGGLDAAVHRVFCRQLQEALGLGEGEVGADEFWECFIGQTVTPPAAGTTGRVLLTSIGSVPSEGIAHLIIGGLTASECPVRGSEDRLEGDSVRRALGMLGVSEDPEAHLREQRRAFYLAVTAATESLTLTRRGSDDAGAPLRESVFWDEFLDLYRAPGETLDPAGFPHLESVKADPTARSAGRRCRRGELRDEAALADLANISEVSPSEIETYLSCPYSWFVRRLNARRPDADVDPSLAGRIAHTALAAFYGEWLAGGHGRVTASTRDEAVAMAARAIEEALAPAGTPEALDAATLLQSVAPAVLALVGRDATFLPGYEPTYIEWAFGGSSPVPAIDLGGVLLKGRADRIDVGPGGLVIIDYKRTTASSLSRIRDKRLVQLQLYAAAASRTLGLPVAGGLYRGLREGDDRGFIREDVMGLEAFHGKDVVDAAEMDELIADAVKDAVDAAAGMRAARIEPTPSADGCRYCAAASFCTRAVAG
jgi:RecB family exonuclease